MSLFTSDFENFDITPRNKKIPLDNKHDKLSDVCALYKN